jgi:hypothetical protein
MSATEPMEWALGDMETIIRDLRASVGILGHLITANSDSNNEVHDDAFCVSRGVIALPTASRSWRNTPAIAACL